jgi:DNA polymerase/3'-5' exonuclease PolX
MKTFNSMLCVLFQEYAARLEKDNANPFRVRAYQNVIDTVKEVDAQGGDLKAFDQRGLMQFGGIGKGIAEKVEEIRNRKTFAKLEALRRTQGALRTEPVKEEKRYDRAIIERIGKAIGEYLEQKIDGTYAICGSYRRGVQRCKDVDILFVSKADPVGIAETFRKKVGLMGGTMKREAKAGTVALAANVQKIDVDLRVVKPIAEGGGLLFLTGSKDFNIRCRSKAKARGFKLTRHGLFDRETGKRIPGTKSERQILAVLDLAEYTEPETRT